MNIFSLRNWLALIVLIFGLSAKAETKDCDDTLSGTLFAASRGLGYRGFLGAQPALTPETSLLAQTQGAFYWGQKIFVVPNFIALKTHDQRGKNTDPLMKSFYLLGDISPERFKASSNESAGLAYAFEDLLKHGLYYTENGIIQKVEAAKAREYFNFSALNVMDFQELGWAFYQNGWCSPKLKGVLTYADFSGSAGLRRGMKRYSRSLGREDYRVVFNQSIEEVLEKLLNQSRRNQSSGSSRFADENLQRLAREAFAIGQAFTVEVRGPKNDLVAGALGFRHGTYFELNSVFYSDIDQAKVAVGVVMERLHNAGIDFVDVGMVTPFTASLKGKILELSAYQELKATLPAEAAVDLTTPIVLPRE